MQNAAARYVAGLGPRDHITATLRALHWLPVEYRVKYKVCTLMHGVVNDRAPSYVADTVVPVASLPGRRSLRSASDGLFDVPSVHTNLGRRAFSVAGPTLWNTLPANIRAISSFVGFKQQLKRFLFEQAYDTRM